MKSTSTILLICLTAALGFGCGSKPDNDEEAGTTASGGTVAEGGATEDATDGGIDGGAGGATDGAREDVRGLETNTARSSIPANCTLDEVSNMRAMSRSRGGVTQSVSFEIDPAGFFLSINGQDCDPNVSFTNVDQCRGTASCGGQQFDYFPEQSLGGLVWVLMDGATRWELGTFTGTLSVAAGTGGTSGSTAGDTGSTGNNGGGGATAGACGASDDARGWTSLVAGTYLWHSSISDTDSAVMLRSDCSYCQASRMDEDDADIGGVYNLAIDGTWEVLDHVVEADGERYTRIRVGTLVYRVWEVHIQQALDSDQIWNVTTIPWTLQDARGGEVGPVSLGIPRLVKQDSGYSTGSDPAFARRSSNGDSTTGYRCSAGGNL